MPLNMNAVQNKQSNRQQIPLIPRGAQLGTLVRVVDLGLQPRPQWQGQDKKPAYRIRLTFELPKHRIEVDGVSRPRWEDVELNVSTFENSTMIKYYAVLDPDNKHKGDWSKLVGTSCAVVFVHNKSGENTYANITDITPLMEGIEAPALENPTQIFDLTSPDLEVFNKLPKFIQDKIKSNLEYVGSRLQKLLEGMERPVTASTPELDVESDIDDANSADNDAPW